MKVFVAEDEPPARERLVETLARVAPQAQVVATPTAWPAPPPGWRRTRRRTCCCWTSSSPTGCRWTCSSPGACSCRWSSRPPTTALRSRPSRRWRWTTCSSRWPMRRWRRRWPRRGSVLPHGHPHRRPSTMAFTVCFMVWMMFGVIGIPIKKMLDLNATEFGLLTATPVLTGSLSRLCRWASGPTSTAAASCSVPDDADCVIAIWLIGYATQYWHFLVLGLFVGLAGGSFSVGTPTSRAGSRKSPPGHGDGCVRRGQLRRGGQQVRRAGAGRRVRLDAGAAGLCRAMLVTAILFWMFSYSDPAHLVDSQVRHPAPSSWWC
jgi:hypothetical protein